MWWECVNGKGSMGPGKRWGHTCNAVKGGKFLYVFGGYGGDNSQTNDVHVFDAVKKTWSKPLMNGTPPSPRDSHSCTTVGNRLFVFGGTDGTNPLNDLHVLDTLSNTWIRPAVTGEGPDAREGHSATLVDKRLFIFGGCGKSRDTHEEEYFNDLYILDTEQLVWECAKTSGNPPTPRDSHTCSSWNKKIIVLGGEDSSDCYLSDAYMLDADKLAWKKLKTSGQMLAPRAGHTTVVLGNKLFVFGGFTDAMNLYDDLLVLNIDGSIWNRVVTVNRGPSARFSVAGDCLDERRGVIVYLGGCNKCLEALDDMYYLHISMPDENGQSKLEKPSVRRMLNRCRESNLLAKEPEKSNDVSMLGFMSDLSHPMHFQAHSQADASKKGKVCKDGQEARRDVHMRCGSCYKGDSDVPFEGKITDVTQKGYAVETIINGKVLRGMLFPSTASSIQVGHTYPNKRRTKLNERRPLSTTVQIMPQDTKISDQEQIVATCAKESTPQSSSMENLAMNMIGSTTHTSLNESNMVSENLELPSLSSRELKCGSESMEAPKVQHGDMMNDSRNLNPSPMQDIMNETEIMESTTMLSEDLKIDSEKLELSAMPYHELNNVSENLEPPLISSEILKNDDISDESQKTGAVEHQYTDFQVEGQEKMDIDKPGDQM